jgi:hypothetical protein
MIQLCPHCGATLPWVVDAFCPGCRKRLDESPAADTDSAAPSDGVPPRTVVVDIPTPSGATWFFVWGVLVALSGLLVRWYARRLAWPNEWHYSGSRENTDWAFNEALYIDLGLVLLAFGLALVFLGLVRVSSPKESRTDTVERGDRV